MTSPFFEADHLSYSSLSTYSSCPRAYYLSRHKRAWGVPAWYFIVGSAVHNWIRDELATEPHSLPRPIEDYFNDEVEKALEIEEDQSVWLHGGSDDDPVVGDKALALARACAGRAADFLTDVDVWGSELDVSGYLPGCTMEIKAYLDIVGEHRKHGPVIIDWKTGRTKPKDNIQLETYNGLLIVEGSEYFKHTVAPKGLFVMLNPDAAQARPVIFKHTPESLGKLYGGIEKQIESKVWKPEPQFNCKFCNMKPNCRTMSGATQRAKYYDTPVKDGGLPF